MARILLYKGQSQYGALRAHVDNLSKAFESLGHISVVIDFEEKDALKKLEKELNLCNFVVSFNGILSELSIDNKSAYNILNLPYITLMLDHPIYHLSRLDNKIDKFVVGCLDNNHLKFLNDYYGKNHFFSTYFMTPGGSKSSLYKEEDLDQFLHNRYIKILFTGSFRGDSQTPWRSYENKSLVKLIDDCYEFMLANEYASPDEAFDFVLKDRKLNLNDEHKNKIKVFIIETLLGHFAAHKRYICLETLAKSGIEVDVYGVGWEEWASNYKNIKYRGNGTVKDTFDILNNTLLCLNINNNFTAGAHERVFNAMINGAPVITDNSLYYNNNFEDGKDILTYSWNKLGDLPDKINEYLSSPQKLWQISKNARRNVLANHTWEDRAKQIIEIYELMIL